MITEIWGGAAAVWAAHGSVIKEILVAIFGGGLVFRILDYYSCPEIGFHEFPPIQDGDAVLHRFLVKNFEPYDVVCPFEDGGAMVIEVCAEGEIAGVKVFAGPWLSRASPKNNPGTGAGVGKPENQRKIFLRGIPAEGVIAVDVKMKSEGWRPILRFDGPVKLGRGGLQKIRPFVGGYRLLYYGVRWFAGIVIGAGVYSIGRWWMMDSVLEVEWLWSLVVGVFASLMIMFFVVPFSGKETVCGYQEGIEIVN